MMHPFPTTRAALDNAARQIIARAYHAGRTLTPDEEADHEALICAMEADTAAQLARWRQDTPTSIPDNVLTFPTVAQD